MTNTTNSNTPDIFQVGDRVLYKEYDWKVADTQENYITLYRESIDGQSKIEKISIKELQEALRH
jgi:hypothetical protein